MGVEVSRELERDGQKLKETAMSEFRERGVTRWSIEDQIEGDKSGSKRHSVRSRVENKKCKILWICSARLRLASGGALRALEVTPGNPDRAGEGSMCSSWCLDCVVR